MVQSNATITLSKTLSATETNKPWAFGPSPLPEAANQCGTASVLGPFGELNYTIAAGANCTINGLNLAGVAFRFNGSGPNGTNGTANYTNNYSDQTNELSDPQYSLSPNEPYFSNYVNVVNIIGNTFDQSYLTPVINPPSMATIDQGQNGINLFSNNWMVNGAGTNIFVDGYSTVTNNFWDKIGCYNGAHPEHFNYFGFIDNTVGSSTTPNLTATNNLFNIANCGTHTATSSWTTASTTITISGTSPIRTPDLVRYPCLSNVPAGACFLIDYTTDKFIGQVQSLTPSCANIYTTCSNQTITLTAPANVTSSGSADVVMFAYGNYNSTGINTNDTSFAVDQCQSPFPGGVMNDTPIYYVQSTDATYTVRRAGTGFAGLHSSQGSYGFCWNGTTVANWDAAASPTATDIAITRGSGSTDTIPAPAGYTKNLTVIHLTCVASAPGCSGTVYTAPDSGLPEGSSTCTGSGTGYTLSNITTICWGSAGAPSTSATYYATYTYVNTAFGATLSTCGSGSGCPMFYFVGDVSCVRSEIENGALQSALVEWNICYGADPNGIFQLATQAFLGTQGTANSMPAVSFTGTPPNALNTTGVQIIASGASTDALPNATGIITPGGFTPSITGVSCASSGANCTGTIYCTSCSFTNSSSGNTITTTGWTLAASTPYYVNYTYHSIATGINVMNNLWSNDYSFQGNFCGNTTVVVNGSLAVTTAPGLPNGNVGIPGGGNVGVCPQ